MSSGYFYFFYYFGYVFFYLRLFSQLHVLLQLTSVLTAIVERVASDSYNIFERTDLMSLSPAKLAQAFLSALGGIAGFFFGKADGLIYSLIAFVVLDYISGVAVAVYDKKLSSEVGFKGIFKKVMIFALVSVGNILDVYVLNQGSACKTAVSMFYIANEGVSIIENCALLGLPVPQKIMSILIQINDKYDKE